jgi:negative regulator of flagellin synthesis FlgM
MSYVNNIGNPQQAISSVTPSVTTQATTSSGSSKENLVQSSRLQDTDQTTLSVSAGLVGQALKSSDTRDVKVASLQQAIAAGSYNVSSSDIADKLVQSLLE